MAYLRVIPRDLFNEADLLKCYGRLWILTERHERAGFDEETGEPFDIVQDCDGALTVANLTFRVRGEVCTLSRPLNARTPWPLWLTMPDVPDFEEVRVFTEAGDFSADMLAFLDKPSADEEADAKMWQAANLKHGNI